MISIAEALSRIVPPWLQRLRGKAFMRGLGDTLDVVQNRTAESIDARFPRATRPDALASIGRDRKILRGPNEPAETYAKRLVRWWQDHRTRGGPYALLRQSEAFWSSAPRRVDLVYASGTRFVLETDGTITRDSVPSNADPLRWSRASVFYYLTEDEVPVPYELYQSLMAIPREWTAAHVGEINVFGLAGGCQAWGYPPNNEWGATPPEPWGCAVKINDLYPSGPPPTDTLTLGGLPVTLDLDEVTL